MKKKTKFRLRNNLAPQFWTAVSLCLVGAAFSFNSFYNSFFRALSKLNEEPIAVITFKKKTAQRKFADRVVWDRLKQNSPVYNGDTIHTASLSEATIWFTDGNVMELSQNSMAQVFLKDDNTVSASLASGEAIIDSSESASGMTFSSSGVTVAVQAGSSVSAASQASTDNTEGAPAAVSLQLLKGTASVEAKGEKAKTIVEGEKIQFEGEKVLIPAVSVFAPKPNEKILYHEEGKKSVLFNWKTNIEENIENTSVVLEIAQDKEFREIIKHVTVTEINELAVDLAPRNYYWRIRTIVKQANGENTEGETASGRIQLIQSLPPSLVAPVQDYEYNYRTKLPAVRLIWSESPYATSYQLDIADSPDFSNIVINQRGASTSSIISTLKEGVYYWRVAPFYTINKEGLAKSSEVHSFKISQKGELVSPAMLLPVAGGNVNTDAKAKDVFFSWKLDSEAVSYNITIADNEQMRNPVVSRDVSSNYYVMESKRTLKDGKWFWSVTQKDSEGNVSAVNEVRSFFALKGELEQHPIEPVEGYKVANTLVQDTKFTWKRNLPANFKSKMQISRDKEFTDIVYTADADGTNIKGISLEEGTYYWHLVAENKEADISLVTDPKSFEVVGNLPAPKRLVPEGRTVVKEGSRVKFGWQPISGVDFYKITVYKKATDEIVYTETVWEPMLVMDLFNAKEFEDKTEYRFTVQGQASEVIGVSSRRSSNVAEQEFKLFKVNPAVISAPEKDSKLDGIKAIIDPYMAEWHSADKVSESEFVLSKIEGGKKIDVLTVPSTEEKNKGVKTAPNKITLDTEKGLTSGTYEMRVNAKSVDDVDISTIEEKNIGRFTIGRIPMLPVNKKLTAIPDVYDLESLNRKENPFVIQLNWDAVPNATEYTFMLKNQKNEVLEEKIVNDTSYVVNILEPVGDESVYRNGVYTWSVEPRRMFDKNKDGEKEMLLQSGRKIESKFSINIPELPGAEKLVTIPEVFDLSLGNDAENPFEIKLTWNEVENATEYIFVIYDPKNRIVERKVLKQNFYSINYLRTVGNEIFYKNGDYKWTVEARRKLDKDGDGVEDLVLQNGKTSTGVMKINVQMLPENKMLSSAPKIVDFNYLKIKENPRVVKISWDKIPNATEYTFTLKNSEGKILVDQIISENVYTVEFLQTAGEERVFQNGTYTWSVEPGRKYDKDGDGIPELLLQSGKVKSSEFVLDVPVPKKAKAKGALNPYGK